MREYDRSLEDKLAELKNSTVSPRLNISCVGAAFAKPSRVCFHNAPNVLPFQSHNYLLNVPQNNPVNDAIYPPMEIPINGINTQQNPPRDGLLENGHLFCSTAIRQNECKDTVEIAASNVISRWGVTNDGDYKPFFFNRVMRDAYPLPRVSSILDRVQDARFLSSVDLKYVFS